MTSQDFYLFSEKFSEATLHVTPNGAELIKSIRNETNGIVTGDWSGLSFPLKFKQKYGRRKDDVIRTGYTKLFIISNNFVDVLKNNSITGWRLFDVEISDKKDGLINGYFGISITGKSGPVNINSSIVIERRRIANGPLCIFYKGAKIDKESWDGSDIFIPEGGFGILLSPKAASILGKSELTNVSIIPLSEVEIDEHTALLIRRKSTSSPTNQR